MILLLLFNVSPVVAETPGREVTGAEKEELFKMLQKAMKNNAENPDAEPPEWVKETQKHSWDKELKEAIATEDTYLCEEVARQSYSSENEKYFNKALDICWTIIQNDPEQREGVASYGITKEVYILAFKDRAKRATGGKEPFWKSV